MKYVAYMLTVLAAIAGCGENSSVEEFGVEADFGRYEAFANEIAYADSVVVYEGLPNSFGEEQLLERELKRVASTKIDDQLFYVRKHEASEDDAEEITRLFESGNITRPYVGPKECGGFHADYAVVWSKGEAKFRALVCFGCHEVLAMGPDGKVITDMTDSGYKELRAALGRYERERPTYHDELYDDWASLHEATQVELHLRADRPGAPGNQKLGRYEMSKPTGQLTDAQKDTVEGILLNRSSFKKHVPKKCVFRPDFGISWSNVEEKNAMVVCLTCEEVKFYNGEFETHLDVSREAAEQLRRTFTKK
jgi:hypothetical protein